MLKDAPISGYKHAVCSYCQRFIHSGAYWSRNAIPGMATWVMRDHPAASVAIDVQKSDWDLEMLKNPKVTRCDGRETAPERLVK